MKKLISLKQTLLSGLFLIAWITASFGQETFKYQSNIEGVVKSGFYKIHLQPILVAKGNKDLSDFRIIDGKNKFVPFVRLQNLPSKEEDFLALPLVSSSLADSVMTLVVENKTSLLLQSLWLKVKNTAVHRKADLLGSDDRLNWFAIQEDVTLDQSSGSKTDTYLQSLSFPPSNYRFLKIRINNGKKEAIKILQVGVFSNKRSPIEYVELPKPHLLKKDSTDKNTYLNLTFNDRFLVNKLNVHVTGPRFYKRQVLIFRLEGTKRELIGETTLQAGVKQEILLASKASKLELQIFNGDNPPLQIDEVLASQAKEYIFAYLESNAEYKLLVGDTKASMPDYDLKYFTDSALANLSEARHSQVISNNLLHAKEAPKKEDRTVLLWLSIAVAVLLLSFLTYRMLNEVSLKKAD